MPFFSYFVMCEYNSTATFEYSSFYKIKKNKEIALIKNSSQSYCVLGWYRKLPTVKFIE